jgi:hypothetical protein
MLAGLGAPLSGDTLYGGPDGAFYLEHILLAARPYGALQPRVWRAPSSRDRPAWSPSLADAVETRAATILSEA